jgi:hypothetical protein
MGEIKNPYKILARISEGTRLLSRPMSRWEDNIEIIRV